MCQTDFSHFQNYFKIQLISKADSANVAKLSNTNVLKGIFILSDGVPQQKIIIFRRLEVFSFEMRIAFFSIIEGFGCFGMGISFNLRYGDHLDDDDDDDDDGGDDDDDDSDYVVQVLSQISRNIGNMWKCQESEKLNLSILPFLHFHFIS